MEVAGGRMRKTTRKTNRIAKRIRVITLMRTGTPGPVIQRVGKVAQDGARLKRGEIGSDQKKKILENTSRK